MNKKLLASTLAVILALSLAACDTDDKDDDDQKYISTTASDNSETTGAITTTTSSTSEISGKFIESVNGKETSYVTYEDDKKIIIGIGEKTGIAIEIEASKDGIIVNRGGIDSNAKPVKYTYDGKKLSYERDGSKYVWTKVDFFPIVGTYDRIDDDDNQIEERWTFKSDGTGTIIDDFNDTDQKTLSFTFKQTKDNLVITSNDPDYSGQGPYSYDGYGLVLIVDNDTETLVVSNQ